MDNLTPSDALARGVKRARQDRGWTQERLAEEMTRRAVSLQGTGITRIEKGARKVTVDEWLALADALDVPPGSLLLPFGQEHIQVTPNVVLHPFDALLWIAGEFGWTNPQEPSSKPGMAARLAIALYRRFDEAREQYAEATDDEWRTTAYYALAEAATTLVMQGLSVPPLPEEWIAQLAALRLINPLLGVHPHMAPPLPPEAEQHTRVRPKTRVRPEWLAATQKPTTPEKEGGSDGDQEDRAEER